MKKIKKSKEVIGEVVGETTTGQLMQEQAPVKTLEQRIQEAFPREVVAVTGITQHMLDQETFDSFQGIKLTVNGQEIKMKWNVDVAAKHQASSGSSFEDIIVNAVVGTLTAWGTCRMVLVK